MRLIVIAAFSNVLTTLIGKKPCSVVKIMIRRIPDAIIRRTEHDVAIPGSHRFNWGIP